MRGKLRLFRDRSLRQFFNTLRYEHSSPRAVLGYTPLSLSFSVTPRCNLRCRFCPYHSPSVSQFSEEFYQPPDDISSETFRTILDGFSGILSVDFCGTGEPFLNKEVFRMIEYAHGRKMETHVTTNGAVMDVDRVIRSHLDTVNVSLFATDRNDYKEISGAGEHTFDLVVEKVKKLTKNRGKSNLKSVLVSFVIHQKNYQQIPHMVALAEDLGVDRVVFQNFLSLEVFYPGRDVGALGCQHQPLYADGGMEAELKQLTSSSRVGVEGPILLRNSQEDRNCILPFIQLITDSAGNVPPCPCNYPEERVLLFEENDVWKHRTLVRRREALLNGSLPLPPVCEKCYYRFMRTDGLEFGGIRLRPPLQG